jgi:hypothetical protein
MGPSKPWMSRLLQERYAVLANDAKTNTTSRLQICKSLQYRRIMCSVGEY